MRTDTDGGDIGGFDADRCGQLGEVGEELVLGYFASSSLHLREVGQHKVAVQAVLSRVKGSQSRGLAVRGQSSRE